jgi:DegV family protein with EDD domain
MSIQKIAIVTDSTADIPDELAEENNIQVVRNTLVIEGRSLEDGRGISRQEFYERLPSYRSLPTTATASSGIYTELYERLLHMGAECIVSIHPASRLSGVVNAATLAAQSFIGRVSVVDSEQASLGLGFQVLEAAAAVRRGITRENLLALLENLRKRARVVAMLDTLDYIRRSGRVSWARARLGDLLHIKPFIELRGGKVLSLGEARTRRKGMERLLEIVRGLGPFQRLAALHTNAEADARQLLAELAPQLTSEPLVVNVTTVIGTHVGPRGLGFALLTKE